MRTTSIRFTGLASGLDTESIVQSMVAPYKLKVDSAKQNQTMMEWRKEAWRDMNSKLFNFYDKYMGQMRLESTFNKKNVTSSNTTAIEIDKNSTLPEGTHSIDSITQLAKGARIQTTKVESLDKTKVTKDTKLENLGIKFQQSVDEQGKPVVDEDGKPVYEPIKLQVSDSVDKNGNKIYKTVELTQDMTVGQIESALKKELGNSSVSFDEGASAFFIATKKTGQSQQISIKSENTDVLKALGIGEGIPKVEGSIIEKTQDGKDVTSKTTLGELGITDEAKIQIKIGDKNLEIVDINKDMTLEELTESVQDQITKQRLDEKVMFKFEDGKFAFSTLEGDVSEPISISVTNQADNSDVTDKVLDALGMVETMEYSTQGENAKLSYNGIEIESETNNVSVNGFNFSIKSTFNTSQVDSEKITIVSTQDTDAIVGFVKEFVDEYNKLIEDINGKLDAPSAKGYSPLTDEQKKEMSDYEIEQWEKKIKDSLFRRDPDLKNILDEMRGILGGSVKDNTFGDLSGIGITTGNWQENGKLYLDEDKLKAALAKDSDAVIQLFAGNGTSEETKGIGDRLYDTINKRIKSSELNSAHSFYNDKLLDKKITAEKEEVAKLQKRMYAMEDMYYKKFTAMEKMMSQLNNQTNSMMSMLGQG